MAQQYSLEQQEQLASIKSFWERRGTPIAVVVLAAAAAAAGWSGWNHWQNTQAEKASILLDQMTFAIEQNNAESALQNFSVLRSDFEKTSQAGQAGLLLGKFLTEQKNGAQAQEVLKWVNQKATDAGYRASALLNESAILIEQNKLDEALTAVQGYQFPAQFKALADDRRGDILQLQGKAAEAVAAYRQAYAGVDDGLDYRKLIEVKLAALGQQP